MEKNEVQRFMSSAGVLLLFLAYETLLTASPLRGTLGKRFMGIMVIGRYGARIGLLRSFWRALAYILVFMGMGIAGALLYLAIGAQSPYAEPAIILFSLTPYLFIALNARKRGIHDYMAGTAVVYD